MKKTVMISVGLVGIAVGFGFILPAVAIIRSHGMLPHLGLLALGVLLALAGVGAAIHALGRSKTS